jgi:hypothetical protein
MKRLHIALMILFVMSLLVTACGGKGFSAEDQAATIVAETATAEIANATPQTAATDTPTPIPTDTPTPISTDTPTPSEIPTETPTPTETPIPTDTPTPTATPGPFTLFDDFSTDSGAWQNCQYCTWENNALTMGPYPPSSEAVHMNLCSGCGSQSTYRVSVDGTFIDGQVDRFFGIVFGVSETSGYYLGISPWQFYVILEYHPDGDWWEVRAIEWSGAVNGSYATNNFEVRVQPAAQAGTVDYFVYLNGTMVFAQYNQPAVSAQVGLGMDFHDVTVSYDNFEYEEIEAVPATP